MVTRNKSVCHLTSAHTCSDVRIFVKQCSSLAAAGYHVSLVAPGCQDTYINGVHIHGVSGPARSRLARMTSTVWSVFRKAVALDSDLYHFHDPELLPVGVLLKLRGKKVVFDMHEDVPGQILDKEWIPKLLRKVVSTAYNITQRCCFVFLDAIVLAETSYRDHLPGGHRYVLVRNYPIANEFSDIVADHDPDQAYVCYIGTIHPLRGLREMVEAVSFTECKLLLAGNLSPYLADQVKASSGSTHVVVLGEVNREGVVRTLSRSRAGLVVLHPIPNYLKTEPTKMLEYMAAGIPVICSNFPYWKRIVEENRCGLCVDPLNVIEISEAIKFLLANPTEAKRMGENGKRVVMDKYSWENEATQLRNLYADLI